MNLAPVTKHRDWRHLIAELQDRKECAFLRNIKQSDLPTVLAPAVAIARWIATQQFALGNNKNFRLLVIGAQQYDAFDQGRWYGLLTNLLGCDLKIITTLVGTSLSTSMTTPMARALPTSVLPANMQKTSLGKFLQSYPDDKFDLVCMFHPGFEHHHQDWLSDDSLANLIRSNTPVIATSYDEGEFQRDRYLLETYGYQIEGSPLINPFHSKFEKAIHGTLDVKWGQVIWKFANRVPTTEHVIDKERINNIALLSQAIVRSVGLGLNLKTSLCATRKLFPESEDDGDFFIVIFNDFLLRERLRQVYVLIDNKLKPVKDVSNG